MAAIILALLAQPLANTTTASLVILLLIECPTLSAALVLASRATPTLIALYALRFVVTEWQELTLVMMATLSLVMAAQVPARLKRILLAKRTSLYCPAVTSLAI